MKTTISLFILALTASLLYGCVSKKYHHSKDSPAPATNGPAKPPK